MARKSPDEDTLDMLYNTYVSPWTSKAPESEQADVVRGGGEMRNALNNIIQRNVRASKGTNRSWIKHREEWFGDRVVAEFEPVIFKKEEKRVRSISTYKSLKTALDLDEFATARGRAAAEEKADSLLSDRVREFKSLNRNIFSMSRSEVESLVIDRDFFGTALSNSLEKAASQRLSELEKEEVVEGEET